MKKREPGDPVRVVFVCLGNICRSPTAEAVMVHLVRQAQLGNRVEIDSAGTGSWHIGEQRDARSRAVGQRRGMPLRGVARQISKADFEHFDYVIAMDRDNRDTLRGLAPDDAAAEKVKLLRAFDPASPPDAEVPDPYYGGPEGFDEVFDICVAGCRGLLEHMRREHGI